MRYMSFSVFSVLAHDWSFLTQQLVTSVINDFTVNSLDP